MNTSRKVRGAFTPFATVVALVVALAAPSAAPARAQAPPVYPASFGDIPVAGPAFSQYAAAAILQEARSRRWEGAALGFAAGAAITWYVLHQGGSTGRCNRRENQDAWSARHCVMAAAAGGLVLAPLGYVIGGRIPVGGRR
jgi:hypothetical protein